MKGTRSSHPAATGFTGAALEAKLAAVQHLAKTMQEAFERIPKPGVDGRDVARFSEAAVFVAERGTKVAVPVAELLDYRDGLFSMLDAWAPEQLQSLDQELKLYQLVFDEQGQRKGEHPTLREFLATHL